MPAVEDSTPDTLKTFHFHGVNVQPKNGSGEAIGDCPFCHKEKKFYVGIEKGLWKCHRCGEHGNPITFLSNIWEQSEERNDAFNDLAEERGLSDPETLWTWGVRYSFTTNEWLVPGWNQDRVFNQLYKLVVSKGKHKLYPSPGLDPDRERHGMFGVHLFDDTLTDVYLCEGWSDPMAWWEALREQGIDANVVGQPGCNVFFDGWSTLFKGKRVILCQDSDHPRQRCEICSKTCSTVLNQACSYCHGKLVGKIIHPPGYSGLQRTAGKLLASRDGPSQVDYLCWGPDGYDPELPEGYDLRDAVCGDHGMSRESAVEMIFNRIKPYVKSDEVKIPAEVARKDGLESLECSSWKGLLEDWKLALRWRNTLESTLAVMLSVATSTVQRGDQIFLQVIGNPGSAKTRLCEAMLVSNYCMAIEHLTGFYSGYKSEDGGDNSILAQGNEKTWITPEGDVLTSCPKYKELMGQQRRIFDGTGQHHYKNQREAKKYTGLRAPWIMAGTPILLEKDEEARLGDRFLKVFIDTPTAKEQDDIVMAAGIRALEEVKLTSNGKPDERMHPRMTAAYRRTGGYVDYLRKNTERLLLSLQYDTHEVASYCKVLAEFVADMRAKTCADPRRYVQASKELPTRLISQFCRLASCLAVVMNKDTIDTEVLTIVRKVALDTSRGKSLDLITELYQLKKRGMTLESLAGFLSEPEDRVSALMRFLLKIKVVEKYDDEGVIRWRVSNRTRELYQEVYEV